MQRFSLRFSLNRVAAIASIATSALIVATAMGCSHFKSATPTDPAPVVQPTQSAPPQAASPQTSSGASSAASTNAAVAPKPGTTAATATQPKQSDPTQKAAAIKPSPKAPPPTPRIAQPTPAKSLESTAKNSAPTPVAPAPAAAPVVSAAPPTPSLDLKSMEQRLRDTRAIGMMTKLSLKNQVDDLLDEFRDFYAGKVRTPLNVLRQKYDLLVMKVLSVLQDGDAALASAINSSREFIWGILRDPKKFADIDA